MGSKYRVEPFPQTIAQQIEAQHGNADEERGPQRE